MKRKTLILSCALLLALLLVARTVAARSVEGYDMSWKVLVSGGRTASAGYTLEAAIGQPFVGEKSVAPYELCAGYLCGAPVEVRVYLPLVRR